MKVCVVGAGSWGMNHVRTLRALNALGGVVEPNEQCRQKLHEDAPDVEAWPELGAVGPDGFDGFVIATPAETHYAVARDLLSMGKDVLVEKPMTLEAREGEELVAIAQQKGAVLMVGHLLLYQPAVERMKRAIEDREIGELQGIHQVRLGLGKARSHEDVLWSLGVHDVAVALYLIGQEPESVSAVRQFAIQPAISDDVYLHMAFSGGKSAHLHTSWLWPERTRRTVLVGSEGMLVYDELAQSLTLHKKRILADLKQQDEGELALGETSSEPLRRELEHFIECIETRREPISSGESAVKVLRVLEAASRDKVYA